MKQCAGEAPERVGPLHLIDIPAASWRWRSGSFLPPRPILNGSIKVN